MDLSPFPYQVDHTGRKLLVFSPKLLAYGAYDEFGQLVRWGAASGGQSFCPDLGKSCKTIIGSFAFYHKRGIDCISGKFPLPDGGAEMPYCMFFKGGFAIHASEFVPGHNASHGCIRIFYSDAQWLHEEFIDIHYPSKGRSTKVIVLPY